MALKLAVVVLGSIYTLYPFLIVISSSFDPTNTLSGQNLIPRNPSLANYQALFASEQAPIARWLANSILVSTISTLLTLTLTTLAAYSLSRFRFSGRRATLLAALIIQVFPTAVALVAFYLLLQQIRDIAPELGLGRLGGVILIYAGGALGANAFLMKGYFDTIPRELDESAQVDGATHWATFRRIILPLIRPILAVIAVLSFVGTFNDFIIPRVLLIDRDYYTLAVGLTTFLNNQFNVRWGVFAAGALVGTVPIVIMFLALQTQLVSGLSQGAVKG